MTMPDSSTLVPELYQPPLPINRLLLPDLPDSEALQMDVVIVGGGPAGLATAIELMRLAKADKERGGRAGEIQVAVLEKAAGIGEHNLSGAVVNPRALRELFPDVDEGDYPLRGKVSREKIYFLTESKARALPTPPTMKNHGFHVASIGEVCRWLAEKAETAGVNMNAT
jgi:electron-transferring-flavoprotein dehydrogenase